MRCWNCRRPSGYREQVLKAIGGLAIALANDGKLEEAQQELDTLQKKGASSGDCDLVAAEILSLQKNYDQALALYIKVFNEVEDPQLLSHAYLSAANAALNQDDMEKAVRILKQGCQNLPEGEGEEQDGTPAGAGTGSESEKVYDRNRIPSDQPEGTGSCTVCHGSDLF